MGRGGYDTTGVPKPRELPETRRVALPAIQVVEPHGAHQSRSPELQHFLDLLPGPMDIEPGPGDDADASRPLQRATPENHAEPQLSHDADVDAADDPEDENMEDDAKSVHPSCFTDEQKAPLDQWMADNRNNPYPTPAEKEQLAQEIGLSTKQVQQYCSNYRRRRLEKSHLSRVASVSSLTNAKESSSQFGNPSFGPSSPDNRADEGSPRSTDPDAPGASIEARPPSHRFDHPSPCASVEQSSPPSMQSDLTDSPGFVRARLSESDDPLLDWWLEEHCDYMPDSAQAHNILEMPPPLPRYASLTGLISGAASVPSITTRHSADDMRSATGSVNSANDSLNPPGSSVYSIGTFTSRGSRRGRRAYGFFPKPQASSSNAKASYECEHCGNTFGRASTLKRHVQSVHTSQERWVCGPVVWTSEGHLHCPTCLQDPLDCKHGMLACWNKPEEDRTFSRKDLLKQHLRGVHQFDSTPRAMKDSDILARLAMHQPLEGVAGTLQRIGAELVKIKTTCYEWASHEHGLARDLLEACWMEALRRAFAFEGEAEPALAPPSGVVTGYCFEQLQFLVDAGANPGGFSGSH